MRREFKGHSKAHAVTDKKHPHREYTVKELILIKTIDLKAPMNRFNNIGGGRTKRHYCLIDPRTWTMVFLEHITDVAIRRAHDNALVRFRSKVDNEEGVPG